MSSSHGGGKSDFPWWVRLIIWAVCIGIFVWFIVWCTSFWYDKKGIAWQAPPVIRVDKVPVYGNQSEAATNNEAEVNQNEADRQNTYDSSIVAGDVWTSGTKILKGYKLQWSTEEGYSVETSCHYSSSDTPPEADNDGWQPCQLMRTDTQTTSDCVQAYWIRFREYGGHVNIHTQLFLRDPKNKVCPQKLD